MPGKPYSKIQEILGDSVIDISSETKTSVELICRNTKTIGLYFADCSTKCKRFTPKLIEYSSARGVKDIQIVLVSIDHDEERYKQSLVAMPWYAVEFREFYARKVIPPRYHISYLPALVILDSKTGEVTESNGVRKVLHDEQVTRDAQLVNTISGTQEVAAVDYHRNAVFIH